jgi:hypothetical protein
MIKESIHGMNPVNVIALFAALSEASAATALPFLDEDSQDIYVWFLIVFPFALTFMFFLTLNFNYTVLYAPSDFSNEKNFLKIFKKPDLPLKNSTHPEPAKPPPSDIQKNAINEKTLSNIKPVKHRPHRAVLTRPGAPRVSPDYRTRQNAVETKVAVSLKTASSSLQHFRSFSKLLVLPANKVDVIYGGPSSCMDDLEQLLSLLAIKGCSADRNDLQATRFILLLKERNDQISTGELMTLVNQFSKNTHPPDTFVVLTLDSSEVFFL